MVSCLPTCQSAGSPAKYPPIKSGDYLLSRFRDVQKYRARRPDAWINAPGARFAAGGTGSIKIADGREPSEPR